MKIDTTNSNNNNNNINNNQNVSGGFNSLSFVDKYVPSFMKNNKPIEKVEHVIHIPSYRETPSYDEDDGYLDLSPPKYLGNYRDESEENEDIKVDEDKEEMSYENNQIKHQPAYKNHGHKSTTTTTTTTTPISIKNKKNGSPLLQSNNNFSNLLSSGRIRRGSLSDFQLPDMSLKKRKS